MRVSSRANKGQFTSVRFGKEPKPAAKPTTKATSSSSSRCSNASDINQ